MKHSSKKALSGFIAMSMALPIAASPELLSVNDILTVKAADQQKTGKTSDGYDYELWNQNGTGNVTMDLGTNGGFSCSWSGIENCLFRTGKKLGSTKGYKDYGNITIDYDVDYQPNGNSYMCVYGWTEDPTVEYYIVEAWGDWRPPGSNASKGTVSSDGKSYDIYTSTRVNQPSIHGTETFEQYWSVNKTNPAKVYAETNLKGTITVSDHFAAWEKSGMKMGKMYEVALNIEGYRSEGKANVKKNVLTIGGSGSAGSSQTAPDTGASTQAPAQGQSQDNPWGQMPWGQTDPSQGQSQDNPWGQMPWGQTDPTQGQNNPWGQMPWGQTDPTQGQNQDPGQSQTPTTGSSSFTASSSLSDIQKTAKAEFTATVPGEATKTDSGKMSKIQYQSKKAGRTKPANVWLPEGYTEGKKYPVLYVNHGVMGGEDDMTKGWGICEMASYFIKKGQVQPFIIVFTQMYTGPNAAPAGITQQDMDYYDDFLYDLTESLMPYMAEHYSVAEGRENTAICGFSMGGRESLYIGMKACDKIGYVAASSPAPGIVPAQDMFLNHRGSMTESEFKFATAPYLLMIGGGTNDSVVGTFPKQYHELYDKNGVDNIWFEKAGAGHDASVGTPLFYNFIGHIFPVASAGSSQTQPTAQTQPTTVTQPTQQYQAPASQAPASQQPVQQPTQGTNGSAADFKFGDINDDTKIDITDLSLLAVHLIDKTKFTDKQTLAADVAYNGKLELADLATLRQFISKVITKLGEGYTAPVNQPVASPSPSKQAQASPSPSKQASPSPSPSQSTFTASGKTYSVGNGQNQHKGDNVDGYSYEIWLDNTGGSGSMTLGSGGTFTTDWSAECSRGNFLARRGRNYDATKKATEYGTIVMDYAADYSASAAGNSRLCVYGWMKNPLVEYYIIEDWVNWCPSPNGQSKTVTIDGAEYEIFQLDHTGPTILGTNETFKQYFSVRKSKRTSGTITVSDHFKAWAAAGWNIGNLTEVALNVEGWESSGKANVTKLTIGSSGSSGSTTTTTPAAQPSASTQTPGQQVPQQTAKSTGSKGKVVNGVWESDADVSWIDASKPMVAISFDDGPIGGSQNPSRIHNALTKNGFHATFFYWGERIAGNEQEIKNAFNAGFEVANHTWTHPYLTQQGDKGKSEVQKTKNALDAIIGGDNDYLLRPPYLSFDSSVGQAVGVPCPNCGLDTQDWNGASKDQIVNTLKSALANGSLRNKVVLCHENYDSTAGAMEEFLPYLKSQGWQCVTVSEMFKAQGKTMQAGQLYNECK